MEHHEHDDLAARLVGGDPRALSEVLKAHGPAVSAAVARKFRQALDAADIEDVLAVALSDLWRTREKFDPGRGSLGCWFRSIAMNAAVDELRRRNRRVPEVPHPLERIASGEGQRDDKDNEGDRPTPRPGLAEAVRALLDQLPSAHRAVLEADIRSFPEPAPSRLIAQDLGISARSVPMYRARARDRIRRGLEGLGFLTDEPES